jgi:membrane protease subunit (stomatin/prohibitin family)
MKSEVISALQPALGRIAQQGIAYDMLINYPREIGTALNTEMSAEWAERRGIEIVSLAMESVTVDDQSAKKIEQLQEARALSNPLLAAGRLAAGQATAMETAAANEGGAIGAFMGMGMAANAGGMNAAGLFQAAGAQPGGVPQPPQMPQQAPPPPPVPAAPAAAPPAAAGWVCGCGHADNTGRFCADCGTAKPEAAAPVGWSCGCGHAGNTGNFCSDCGARKVSACPGCGWTPSGDAPRFCPECGTNFGG